MLLNTLILLYASIKIQHFDSLILRVIYFYQKQVIDCMLELPTKYIYSGSEGDVTRN